jgi:hypothetical protein
MHQSSLALLSLVLAAAALCKADIIYDVSQTFVNEAGAGDVTGFIETDGTVGVLGAGNILDWNLLLNSPNCSLSLQGPPQCDGTSTFDLLGPLSGSNSELGLDADLDATETQLLFDFSGTGILEFVSVPDFSNYLCFAATESCFAGLNPGELLYVNNDTANGNILFFTSLSGMDAIGTAASSSTPEPSTLALPGAGIVLLGFRKRWSKIAPKSLIG